LFGNAGQTNYSAAKAGIVGMTQTVAKEWGRMNVTVNCVAHGLIKTRLTDTPALEDMLTRNTVSARQCHLEQSG
jgi:3-oxoacyl-[acyl-carrier protein] reductase